MKITRKQLKQIIKEELDIINENYLWNNNAWAGADLVTRYLKLKAANQDDSMPKPEIIFPSTMGFSAAGGHQPEFYAAFKLLVDSGNFGLSSAGDQFVGDMSNWTQEDVEQHIDLMLCLSGNEPSEDTGYGNPCT